MSPWDLYDRLIEGVPEDLKILRCQVGLHWVLVESAGTGMAMSPSSGTPRHSIGKIAGRPVREIAKFAKSWNFLEAAIGMAAMNSWYNAASTLAKNWKGLPEAGGGRNLFEEWEGRLSGRKVAVIGHFPGLERLGKLCELSILERVPQPGDFPDPSCEYLLPSQDAVIATGTTLINKTFPRLLSLSGNAEFALTGPTTPLAPALLEAGASCLGGSLVTLPEEVWEKVAEGGDRSSFCHGTRMLQLSRDNR